LNYVAEIFSVDEQFLKYEHQCLVDFIDVTKKCTVPGLIGVNISL